MNKLNQLPNRYRKPLPLGSETRLYRGTISGRTLFLFWRPTDFANPTWTTKRFLSLNSNRFWSSLKRWVEAVKPRFN